MRVLVNGRSVREYTHNGMSFIESRNGSTYTIKIKNDNGWRVMAVVSVDGLDVITGKPAEESNTGYIIDAYSNSEIKGYRVTDDTSAAFVFVSKEGSYTTQVTGTPKNSGVIGLRVFKEKVDKKIPAKVEYYTTPPSIPWNPSAPVYPNGPWNPNYPDIMCRSKGFCGGGGTYSAAAPSGMADESSRGGLDATPYMCDNIPHVYACSANDSKISSANFDTGTTWGNEQTDKVRSVHFHRGKMICESVIYYASKEALLDMGVDMSDSTYIGTPKDTMPQAFGTKYCKPPVGWKCKGEWQG